VGSSSQSRTPVAFEDGGQTLAEPGVHCLPPEPELQAGGAIAPSAARSALVFWQAGERCASWLRKNATMVSI
jgi:hypothetical protein